MQQVSQKKRSCIFSLLGITFILAMVAWNIFFSPFKASALSTTSSVRYLTPCSRAGDITNDSLLVVLLDRSGSLTYQPGATDPDGYSTSVTKALADLWPGTMAVIPFSNDATPVLGPTVLSDQNQRSALKDEIENYPIGGDTPLAPAMHKALDLLKNAASGSRVIIVTDGEPDPSVFYGVNQANDIRSNLIPQFCAKGIPISAFGLALDLTRSSGQIADRLLHDIAVGTGGAYINVRDSKELAQVVIKLYADWQHLIFAPTRPSNNAYIVPIDAYAKKVIFITFRSTSNIKITLKGPNGQLIPDEAVQRAEDRHYEIDSLVLSDVNQPGSYSINASGDKNAQVYALVESRLHAILNEPTALTVAYIGQSFTIEAELYEDSSPIIPKSNEATVNAHITFLVDGQSVSSLDVELAQVNDSPIFTRTFTMAGPVGEVHVQIQAVYIQIPVEASEAQVTISLKNPTVIKSKSVSPPIAPCGINVSCYMQRYSPYIEGIPLALLLLAILLFWKLKTGPSGVLKQGQHMESLRTMRRPMSQRFFHKSALSASELEQYGGFDFHGARFDLSFGRGIYIKTRSDVPRINIKKGRQFEAVIKENKDGVDLSDNDLILVEKCAPATFLDDNNL
jgi:hypothetical protein